MRLLLPLVFILSFVSISAQAVSVSLSNSGLQVDPFICPDSIECQKFSPALIINSSGDRFFVCRSTSSKVQSGQMKIYAQKGGVCDGSIEPTALGFVRTNLPDCTSSSECRDRIEDVCTSNGGSVASFSFDGTPNGFTYACNSPAPLCLNESQCRAQADAECSSNSQVVSDFAYVGPGELSYSCVADTSPGGMCEQQITNSCLLKGGLRSSNYTDRGDGTSSCVGTCSDGFIVNRTEECTIENNYCDVADNSDLDFTPDEDEFIPEIVVTPPEEEDYDSNTDPTSDLYNQNTPGTSGSTYAQADKLISEVIELKNSNTLALENSTKSITDTIIEKSNDISESTSNSANGVIDTMNLNNGILKNSLSQVNNSISSLSDSLNNTAFDDSNIISAINEVKEKIPESESSYESPDLSGWSDLMFGSSKIQDWEAKIDDLKVDINSENESFENSLQSRISFSVTSPGYETNLVDLGKWGSHDVSLSRFSDYFGGIANILYFIASLTALSIVLGGIRL
jgi:hypothetical protein